MYKQDKASVLDVLLSTRSFDNLVTEITAMRQVGESDSATVSTIETLKTQISQRRVELLAEGRRPRRWSPSALRPSARSSDLQTQQTMLAGVKKQIAQMQAAAAAAARARRRAGRAAAAAARRPPRPVGGGGGGGTPLRPAPTARSWPWPSVPRGPLRMGRRQPGGFDCSGLAMYCYAQFGVSLPHNAAMQYAECTPVAQSAAQPGDLVFFGYSAGGIHHVGIYVGGGSMIDAPYTGVDVRYDSAFNADFFGVGRP